MFCLIAIFKNESEILEEWIQHYLKEGCSHFFLIDNGSTDEYVDILNKFSKYITLIKDNKKHSQAELYNKYFLNNIQKYEWTVICDLDEFVYARDKYNTIDAYLNSLSDNITQIAIPWKIFGSNGFNTEDKKEPDSVIRSFTKRINYDKKEGFQGVSKINGEYKMDFCKCICRSNAVRKIGIHNSNMKYGITIQSNSIKTPVPFVPMNEKILCSSYLNLNHYAIRSLDWFKRVKQTRGSANSTRAGELKGKLSYFYEFDKVSNDIDDYELKNKTY